MPISTFLSKCAQVLAVILVFCGAVSPAFAEDERDFQEHYQRGVQLYKLNVLRQAVKEFAAAYAINPLPRLLYNMGQLQRKVGDYKDAIESYELYLRTEAELSPERKKEIVVYLDALRAAAPGTSPSPLPGQDAALPAPDPGASRTGEATLLLVLPSLSTGGKAGRFMFNSGIGYSYPFFDLTSGAQGGLVVRPEIGIAVLKNRNGYLIFSPQVEIVQQNYRVLLTLGFQYDFPILVRGLFLHLSASAGYALGLSQSQSQDPGGNVTTRVLVEHRGVVIPELGFKYVVNGKVNFGFHPVSLPVSFTATGVAGSFRTTFYGGYNF